MKAKRKETARSLRRLSVMTGVSHTHLMDIENGKKEPTITKTLRLLEALRIPVKDYFEAIGYKDQGGKMVAVQGLEPRTSALSF